MKSVFMLLGALLLTACSDDPYRHLYEGIKANQDAKRMPSERDMNPAPSYDAYKKERDSQSK